jgi:hypothetical protein
MSDQPRRFFRILTTPEPGLDDFRSNEELGIVPRRPLQGEAIDWWRGLSVFDSLAHAIEHRGRSAWLGTYVAVIDIAPGLPVLARRTTGTIGHWTVWAEAAALLESVTAIIDITHEESSP